MFQPMLSKILCWLRTQPIETPLLFTTLFSTALIFSVFNLTIDDTLLQGLGYYAFFGLGFLGIATFTLAIYLPVKIFFTIGQWCVAKYIDHRPVAFSPTTHVKVLYLAGVFVLFVCCIVLLLDQIYQLSPEKVSWASQLVNSFDMTVFGGYVPFSLQRIPFSELSKTIFIQSYMLLTPILSMTFLLLLVTNVALFRKYVLAFLLTPLLSAPIWFMIPAVSPSDMYLRNVTSIEIPPAIQEATAVVEPRVSAWLASIEEHKSQPDKGTYANTAFPSMHVAWGTVATFFCILLWRPFALLLIPWMILNIMGAVYTLQHYAIDMIAGLVIAGIAIKVVYLLLELEKKYTQNRYDPYTALYVLQKDVCKAKQFISDVAS